jgi:hypothetical protein
LPQRAELIVSGRLERYDEQSRREGWADEESRFDPVAVRVNGGAEE